MKRHESISLSIRAWTPVVAFFVLAVLANTRADGVTFLAIGIVFGGVATYTTTGGQDE